MVVAVIDKITGSTKPLQRFYIWQFDSLHHTAVYGFGGTGFCNDVAMKSVNPASLPS